MERYLGDFELKRKNLPRKALRRWRMAFTATVFAISLLRDYRKAAAKRRANQIIMERVFVITNFVLEIPCAVFDQLSSKRKTQYALIAVAMSLATFLVCITELAYEGRKGRVAWSWRHKIPWLYYPSPEHRPFGRFTDIVALLCAIFQCIFTAIAYVFYRRNIDNPIQISIMPLVFAFCLLCSKFKKNSDEKAAYSTEIKHLRIA